MKFPILILFLVFVTSSPEVSAQSIGCQQRPEFPIILCPELFLQNPPYRPADGTLKNRCRNFGASFKKYDRLFDPHYDDCVWKIRKSAKTKSELPQVRSITNKIMRSFRREVTPDTRVPNFLAAMMGQYVCHDIGSRVDSAPSADIQCCNADLSDQLPVETRHPSCMPIMVPEGDQDYQKFHPQRCLSAKLARSMNVSTRTDYKWPKDQVNQVTAYVDNSNLYGSTPEVTNSLRLRIGGRMITNSENILPEEDGDFILGDRRLIQTPQLALLHSIYLREHNRVAGILEELNPHWDDERIFQETRRINIAQFQHIVYTQFLPTFLAPSMMRYLADPVLAIYPEASTFNEFTGAVFRIFHSFLPTMIKIIGADGSSFNTTIHEMTNNKTIQFLPPNYDSVARGLLMQQMSYKRYEPDMFHGVLAVVRPPGLDLPALDVIRGRDHGLPPYVNVLKLVNIFRSYRRFEDLSPYMSAENIQLLKDNYESVEDVDLFVGCLLETPLKGTMMGPTAQLIFVRQFIRLKVADPYFYTNIFSPRPFNRAQLIEIRKSTTNHLFCLNTKVTSVPRSPLHAPNNSEDLVVCNNLSQIDYSRWKENPV